jgi:hypothetical protein
LAFLRLSAPSTVAAADLTFVVYDRDLITCGPKENNGIAFLRDNTTQDRLNNNDNMGCGLVFTKIMLKLF